MTPGGITLRGALLAVLLALPGADLAADTRPAPTARGTVVLLHGLARSARSMNRMADALARDGFDVCNIDYPSTQHDIETLAREYVAPAIARCAVADEALHFVTHSMGGIIVRMLDAQALVADIDRVVMLSPPNGGSEVVDRIGDWRAFGWINGPAGRELGTGPDSVPNRLGRPSFDAGIITGTRSINWINSTMIDGSDDGKVSVASARLEGMRDFRTVTATHPFIMRNREVIRLTTRFLRFGSFDDDPRPGS